jgi:cobalt-zinc-cadmium efflux system protein
VLGVVLALTLAFTAVEIVGGLLTGSLALLADAVHMLSDNLALTLALVAVWLAGRPSTPERTFGYQRAEILAALANGVILVALALWIFVEAARRLTDPPDVDAGTVLAVGVVGLGVNLVAARVLLGSAGASLNVRAALVHVLADALASIGVIVAAVVILLTGWERADPLVSIVIGFLVLASSWGVLRESTEILMERTPSSIDAEQVGRAMAGLSQVVGVHDLHIWTITSGFPSLSAHVIVDAGADCHHIRVELERLLRERFGLEHTTLQVEHEQGLIELGRR